MNTTQTTIIRTLAFVLSLFCYTAVISQTNSFKVIKSVNHYQYKKIYKWELYTAKGSIVFGVSKSLLEAESIISDFTKRNWNTSFKPLHHHITEDIAESQDYFKVFKEYCPKGYRVLSTAEVTALRLIYIADLRSATLYYGKCSSKNMYQTKRYLTNLHDNFKPYRISK